MVTAGMLSSPCATYANWIAEQIDALRRMTLDEEGTKALHKLYRLHGAQSGQLASLGAKLRLTPSSRATPDQARDARKITSADGTPKPWDDWRSTTDDDPPSRQ
jgi:hypothetical protein